MTRRQTRPGYTLLEVLLASAIALFLLAGLYVAMDVTLVRMDITRTMVASNDLSRAVANRMTSDLANTLGPLPPKSGGQSANASDDGTSAVTDPSAGGSSSASTTSSSATSSSSAPPAIAATLLPFGLGVVGTENQLTLFRSRLPQVLTDADAATATVQLPADLGRVTYYLASDGSGLCRQERPWVTASGVGNATDPDRSDEAADLLAPEVKAIAFEYFDGGGWTNQWDGAVTDLDGVALTGPPRAVRITLTLELPGRGGVPVQKQVTHTVAVRAAVGNYQPPVDDTMPDPAATTPAGSN